MNIFYLDKNPIDCAKYHNDLHLMRMIYEYTQLLCHPLELIGIKTKYQIRRNYSNHRCSKWVRNNSNNYEWLKTLTIYLCEEQKYRFNIINDNYSVIKSLPDALDYLAPKEFNEPPLQMDNLYTHCRNKIECYRVFYRIHKKHLNIWTKRKEPEWLITILDDIPDSEIFLFIDQQLDAIDDLICNYNIPNRFKRSIHLVNVLHKYIDKTDPIYLSVIDIIEQIKPYYFQPSSLWNK